MSPEEKLALSAEDKLARIHAMHYPASDEHDNVFQWCGHCGLEWPCPTMQIVEELS